MHWAAGLCLYQTASVREWRRWPPATGALCPLKLEVSIAPDLFQRPQLVGIPAMAAFANGVRRMGLAQCLGEDRV